VNLAKPVSPPPLLYLASLLHSAEGPRSGLAGIMATTGNLEYDVNDLKSAEQRMVAHELKQERMAYEEQDHVIREQLSSGMITEEEATKRLARGRMHMKIEEESSAFKLDEQAAAGAGYLTTQQILEEVLDTDDKILCIRYLKRVTGWYWLMKKATDERAKRKKLDYKHRCPWIEKLVHGKEQRYEEGAGKEDDSASQGSAFEMVLGCVLLVNGLLIGVQASRSGDDEEEPVFAIMEHIFTVVFTTELVLRLIADGWVWLIDKMNFFDFLLIVTTGILPMWILGPLGIKSNAMRMISVLRVLRLIKLIRMVRTVAFFRIFWTLIRGLLDSGRTLFWTYVMICSVLYVFSVFGVYLIGKDEAYKDDPVAQSIAHEHFGDVPKTFVTLFQVMTLDSWTAIARPLMVHSDIVAPYFIFFILIVVLALLNLITAVIINNAESSAQKDQEMKAREAREEANKEIDDLHDMFSELDTDGGGTLSRDEYDDALKHNIRIQQKFQILGISEEEQDEVFDILDTGNGEIGIEQFAAGLRDMQGDAKAKDSFTICKKVAHINKHLGNLSVRLKRQQESADELRAEINEAHRQMGGMIVEMRDVMQYLAICVPSDGMKRQAKDLEKLDTMLKKRKAQLETIGLPQEPSGGAMKQPQRPVPGAKAPPKKSVGFSMSEEVTTV
jgi:voltage-gated sodium channel